jgi:hypothetical protein
MRITIDASAFDDFADRCDAFADGLSQAVRDSAYETGMNVHTVALTIAQEHRRTGSMADNIGPTKVDVQGSVATANVPSRAVSGKGFPYPVVIERGRRAGPNGKGAFKGVRLMERALEAAVPNVPEIVRNNVQEQIDRAFGS